MTSFDEFDLFSTKSSKNSGSSWFSGLFSGFIFSVVVVEVSSVVVMEVVVVIVVVEAVVVVVVSGSFSTRILFINFTFFSGQFSSSSPKAHSFVPSQSHEIGMQPARPWQEYSFLSQ